MEKKRMFQVCSNLAILLELLIFCTKDNLNCKCINYVNLSTNPLRTYYESLTQCKRLSKCTLM